MWGREQRDMQWGRQDIGSLIPSPTTQAAFLPLADVAYGDGRFVAVGSAHLILLGTEASQPPTLSDLRVDPAGTVEIALAVSPGTRYRIEVSEDLINWQPLVEGTSESASVQICDSSPRSEVRFYRAMAD